jgi:hypothetical protein
MGLVLLEPNDLIVWRERGGLLIGVRLDLLGYRTVGDFVIADDPIISQKRNQVGRVEGNPTHPTNLFDVYPLVSERDGRLLRRTAKKDARVDGDGIDLHTKHT